MSFCLLLQGLGGFTQGGWDNKLKGSVHLFHGLGNTKHNLVICSSEHNHLVGLQIKPQTITSTPKATMHLQLLPQVLSCSSFTCFKFYIKYALFCMVFITWIPWILKSFSYVTCIQENVQNVYVNFKWNYKIKAHGLHASFQNRFYQDLRGSLWALPSM